VSPTRGWLCPRIKNIYRLHNTLAVKGAFSQRMRANRRSRLNVNGFRGMAFFALRLRQQCACACASWSWPASSSTTVPDAAINLPY